MCCMSPSVGVLVHSKHLSSVAVDRRGLARLGVGFNTLAIRSVRMRLLAPILGYVRECWLIGAGSEQYIELDCCVECGLTCYLPAGGVYIQ